MKNIVIKVWFAIAFALTTACTGIIDEGAPLADPMADVTMFTQSVTLDLKMSCDLGADADEVVAAVDEWNRALGTAGKINLMVVDSSEANVKNDVGKGAAYYQTKFEAHSGMIWISNYTNDTLMRADLVTAIGHALIGRVEYIDSGRYPELEATAYQSAVMREFNGGSTQVTIDDLKFVADFRNYQR